MGDKKENGIAKNCGNSIPNEKLVARRFFKLLQDNVLLLFGFYLEGAWKSTGSPKQGDQF